MKKLLILILLLLISGCSSDVVYEKDSREPTSLDGPYNVTYVVDGDTLDYDLGNGSVRRIRFSGINTPETGECYYLEAKNKLKDLTLGKEVYLEFDRSDTDKYGRYLRYVYVDDFFVNGYMVRNGYARVFDKYKSDTKRYDQLKKEEEVAKRLEKGVWNCTSAYQKCAFVANNNSKIYFPQDCKYAKKVKPEKLVCFMNEVDAINSGRRLSTGC